MRLEHAGQALQLNILGYQFQAENKDLDDMNWLYIEGKVCHPGGSWTFHDSCLMTGEVLRLAHWLEAVAKDEAVNVEESFIEPNLSFRLEDTSNGRHIRVYFELEPRPPWGRSSESNEVWIEFPIIKEDLLTAATSLREQLKIFPPRTTDE
jgi:hypothetical protein